MVSVESLGMADDQRDADERKADRNLVVELGPFPGFVVMFAVFDREGEQRAVVNSMLR